VNWVAHFHAQDNGCAALGSPFTARLLRLLADHGLPPGPLADRIAHWPGDLRAAAVGLRLAGALNGLVIEGRDPALAAVYPVSGQHPSDDQLRTAVTDAILRHEGWLMARLDLAPQTNEVRRSSVLIAAAHWLRARYHLPFVLSELGASAGLNLMFDRYALRIGPARFGPDDPVLTLNPEWHGPLPEPTPPVIADRAGADLAPLDPKTDRARILSYIWPDQPDRIARTEAALALARQLRPQIARMDAADWLAHRLAAPRDGHLHLVFHTIARQYFPPDVRARVDAHLDEAGARATATAPVAHVWMEADATPDSAALGLRLWPGGVILDLGRADFHGRWVRWTPVPGRKADAP
jgi:hypothetical protein